MRASIVGLVVGAAVITGCGFPVQDNASPLHQADLPPGLQPGASPPPSESAPRGVSPAATLWFVAGGQLHPARREISDQPSVALVLDELTQGPTAAEQSKGMRSALPDADVIAGVSLSRGTSTVQLRPGFGEISPDDQVLAVGQIVLTLTDVRGVGSVAFHIDGESVAVPLPNGESTDEPVVREEYLILTG